MNILRVLFRCASETTCGSRAGSLYHERHDAQTYADWGVDYLKFDDCGEMNLASYAKFSIMRATFMLQRSVIIPTFFYTPGVGTIIVKHWKCWST